MTFSNSFKFTLTMINDPFCSDHQCPNAGLIAPPAPLQEYIDRPRLNYNKYAVFSLISNNGECTFSLQNHVNPKKAGISLNN